MNIESLIKKINSNKDFKVYEVNPYPLCTGEILYNIILTDYSTKNNPNQLKLFEDYKNE